MSTWEVNHDALAKSVDLLEKDLFQFGVPLLKSFQVDENGDVIIEGIASVKQTDHQGEDLDPRGFVLNYFEKSGWIKWEHKGANNGPASPDQFIGEPIEARITPEGQFYLKARLYRDSPYTQQVKEQLEILEKSQSSRKMGFSIEGQALVRDPKNKLKVLKAIIRNVVLTMNPVNDGTWVALAKSLTSPEALEVGLDSEFSLEKALGTAEAAAVMPQSIEGAKPNDEDETTAILKSFRSYVKKLVDKELTKSLLHTDAFSIVQGAYDHAVDSGLSHERAVEFCEYVYQNREVLKSVPYFAEQGGAGMGRLSQILGESMDELEKSLNPQVDDEDAELDALVKSLEGDDGDDDEDDGDDGDGDDDDMEKSAGGDMDLMKSMSDESVQVIDVSEFLGDLVKSLNGAIGAVSADQLELAKGIAVLGRALKVQTELVKSLQAQMEEVGATPRGRRSAVAPNEVRTAQRQGGEPLSPAPAGDELQKSQVIDILFKASDENKIPFTKVSAFEMGYGLDEQTAVAAGLDPVKNAKWITSK